MDIDDSVLSRLGFKPNNESSLQGFNVETKKPRGKGGGGSESIKPNSCTDSRAVFARVKHLNYVGFFFIFRLQQY